MRRQNSEFVPLVTEREPLGFTAWRDSPSAMRSSHAHADIEINFVVKGEVEYFLGGRSEKLEQNTLAIFWAGMPHILSRNSEGAELICVVVPLAWILQWHLPGSMNNDLLSGKMLRAIPGELDEGLFARWCDELTSIYRGAEVPASREIQRIVALELEASLRRFAMQRTEKGAYSSERSGAGTNAQIEKLAAFMGAHYREDITVQAIAASTNLHPNYAMQLFRQRCGMSLWEYVLRLRISHTQYLLLTSERKIEDIAVASGFTSPGRFYAAFSRYVGIAPRSWREMQRTHNRDAIPSRPYCS